MITKIKLVNWKTHENTELEFDRGINILVGIIGSGKTSVMDAISFALFGTFPDLQNRKFKLDDVIMRKPYIKNKAEVEVHFTTDGNNYIVKRVIERGKGTTRSEFRENGKLLEIESSQRVTELVEKKLKISYELFSKIIYSKQNAIDYFLTIPKGKRMKQLDELLLIDKFEKARSSVVSLINRIEDRIKEKENFLQRMDIKSMKIALNQLQLEIERNSKEKEEMEKKIKDVTVNKLELERSIRERKKLNDELREKNKEFESYSAAIKELENILERIGKGNVVENIEEIEKKFIKLQKKTDEIKTVINEKRNELVKTQKKISEIKTEIKFTDEKIEKIEKEIKEFLEIEKEIDKFKNKYTEKRKEEIQRSIDDLKTKLASLKGSVINEEDSLMKLSTAGSKCPVCGSKLNDKKKKTLIEKHKENIEKMKIKILETEDKIRELEKKEKEVESNLKRIEEIESKKKDIEKKKSELEIQKNMKKISEDNLKNLMKDEEEIEKEIELSEKELEKARREKEETEIILKRTREYKSSLEKLNELKKKRDDVSKRIEILKEELKGIEISKEEEELKKLIKLESELGMKISMMKKLIEEKQKRANEIKSTIINIEKEEEEANRLREILIQLKIFKSALQATQVDLRNEFITVVNFYMNKVWSTLYPYADFPSIRFAIESNDYVLQLQERSGVWMDVDKYSGGERSLAALTMRVAFALSLAPQLKILILDEPTHNLDQKSIEELTQTLKESITKFMDQVFIITHEERLEEAVTGSAYKLERDKSIDGVTKPVRLR